MQITKSLRDAVLAAIVLLLVLPVTAGGKKEVTEQGQTGAQSVSQSATQTQSEKPSVLRAVALNGPSGIPMSYLFENHPDLNGVESTFETVASADVLLPKLLKGELDIGILPPNAAAKVYTKNNGAIVMGAVVGQGMLNLITKDTSIKSLQDLKGKTVSVAGQGATPEYVFRYILAQNGIAMDSGEDSVKLDFSIPSAELATALLSDKTLYAVVPEPFSTVATTKDSTVIRAINIQEEFNKLFSNIENFPMTVVVIRSEFASKYPETVRSFLASYKEAIEWANANPAECGQLVEKHTLGLKAAIATKAIPNAAFIYQSAADSRQSIEQLLNVFLSFSPESIGGSLPSDGFYFN